MLGVLLLASQGAFLLSMINLWERCVMRFVSVLGCGFGLVFMAGCMSSGSDTAALEARVVAADEMLAGLQELSPTSPNRVPTTGAATFQGFSGLIIDPVLGLDIDDVVLLGDVALEVSYTNPGAVTGVANNFEGIVGTGDVSAIVPTSGAIQIGQTATGIGQGRPANEWTSDYAGVITVDGEQYEVSGELEGGLLGNRSSDPTPERFVKGIFGQDLDGVAVTESGSSVPVAFEVIATNP